MKILVLHWHGICPHCKKPSCIYAHKVEDMDENFNVTKYFKGFECGSCDQYISEEKFDKIEQIDIPCPKEVIVGRK